jgi:Glycosyltransferase family 10 (fucosyltransferase) C-term
MQNDTGYTPVIYANYDVKLPEMNWQVYLSVDCFNFSKQDGYRVFWQMEPDEIIPGTEEKLIRNHKFYDLILTWNHMVLSECGNAKFFAPGSVWTQEADTKEKKFAVSYLISSKEGCPGYELRHRIFKGLPPSINRIPITKHQSPPYLPDKRGMLVPFQYTIVIENAYRHNYFTEKLLDAFATKTIPIYWGCPRSFDKDGVGEFFNTDGVIAIKDYKELFQVISSLTPDFYQSKQVAIEENYKKALTYADRTGNLVKMINASWIPNIAKIHSGEPNVAPES